MGMEKKFEITSIQPIFNEGTPFFGNFTISATIINLTKTDSLIDVACMYSRLTRPGVYYKNEPQIEKEYMQTNIEVNVKKKILCGKDFHSDHPEVKGELIVSIHGTGIIKSIPLRTSFAPKGD